MKSTIHKHKNNNINLVFKIFLYILIVFVVCSQAYAQQEINTEFKTQTLQVYQNLDKNRVPHGILLDFGMEFTNLRAFNGALVDSTLTTSQTLSDTYKTLLMCRVRSVNNGFISPVEYANRWYNQREEGVITLSGQYFKYSRFADDAYPSKINYFNNQFSDRFISGVWQNPYQEQSIFVMAPSISNYRGLNFKVKLPQNLLLSNYANTIQSIQIDFNDGLGYRIIPYNSEVDVSYSQPDAYIWKYKITLTNGQTLHSHSKVIVEKGLNAVDFDRPSKSKNIEQNNLDIYYKKKITATVPVFGRYGSATVYVRYRQGGNNIQKPLIVAEGFDPGVILSREIEGGQNNIIDFIDNYTFSGSQLLEQELNTYDIIYVDWDNGVDFLQLNAMVLQEVIKWVNQQKASNGSTEPNVVLGQSMGGLIARYALRDIELNWNYNHDTHLYISHDAPHLGANVPYSVQYSARHLRNLYIQTPIALLTGDVILPMILNFADGITTISNEFLGTNMGQFNYVTPLQAFSIADVPAARQMQYTWVSNNYGIHNTIHQAWMQEYNNLGFPQGYTNKPIRNISIANGSECGFLQPDNGNILSYIKDAGRDTFLSNYIGLLDAVYGALLLRPDIVITSLFPGNSYWEIDFQSRYMTNLNQNKQIYKGSIKYKKKVFWFIPVSITVTNRTVNQPSGILPYDIYGGGFDSPPASQLPLSGIVSNRFGFIPTASALAIGSGNTSLTDFDYRQSFVGALPPASPKNTPFDNFVTHFDNNNINPNNSPHISFNRRNGNWLQSELNESTPIETTNCSFACGNISISESSALCASATFSVPEGADFVFWSVTPSNSGVTINSGQGTSQITLTLASGFSGSITITANMISANCGNNSASLTLWSGKPSLPNPIYGPSTVQSGAIVNYQSGGSAGATSYEWWLPYPYETVTNFDYFGQNWQKLAGASSSSTIQVVSGYAGNNGYVQVMGKNECGLGGARIISVSHSSSGGGNMPIAPPGDEDENKFLAYPNPSNNILNIDTIDSSSSSLIVTSVSGKLYDIMGLEKSQVIFSNNKATLNLNGLNKGIYVLKIFYNDKVESHQIAVN